MASGISNGHKSTLLTPSRQVCKSRAGMITTPIIAPEEGHRHFEPHTVGQGVGKASRTGRARTELGQSAAHGRTHIPIKNTREAHHAEMKKATQRNNPKKTGSLLPGDKNFFTAQGKAQGKRAPTCSTCTAGPTMPRLRVSLLLLFHPQALQILHAFTNTQLQPI